MNSSGQTQLYSYALHIKIARVAFSPLVKDRDFILMYIVRMSSKVRHFFVLVCLKKTAHKMKALLVLVLSLVVYSECYVK